MADEDACCPAMTAQAGTIPPLCLAGMAVAAAGVEIPWLGWSFCSESHAPSYSPSQVGQADLPPLCGCVCMCVAWAGRLRWEAVVGGGLHRTAPLRLSSAADYAAVEGREMPIFSSDGIVNCNCNSNSKRNTISQSKIIYFLQ